MALAAAYNQVTGASITHKDVQEWGWFETKLVMAAIEFWN